MTLLPDNQESKRRVIRLIVFYMYNIIKAFDNLLDLRSAYLVEKNILQIKATWAIFSTNQFLFKLDFELLISPENTKQYYMLLRWYETHFYIVCYTLYKFIATIKSIEPYLKIRTYKFI